jgi:Poly(ADP-ribose) polymerase and DNA-Ligase Zn-finger region
LARMRFMIESAKSGRAACRSCKEKIAKGELRFGESNQMFEGSYRWHHLKCAAEKLPVLLANTLAEHTGDEIPDRQQLEDTIASSRKGKAVPRGELAPSGRASCMACGDKIAKAALRVVAERDVEGLGQRPGYLHPKCALEHVGLPAEDLEPDLRANSDLDETQLTTLLAELG